MNWLMVFIGGGLGSVMRYALSVGLSNIKFNFPLATFLSNLSASIILALAAYWYLKHGNQSSTTYLFVAVGFCGGFSTFSTFSLETFELMRRGMWSVAVINILVSIAACLIVIWLLFKAFR